MARRGLPPIAEQILAQDTARRGALQVLQEKQARRNALAKEIGQAKRSGANSVALEAEGAALRDDMAALETAAAEAETAQTAILKALPNILDADVPDGADESANIVLHQHGQLPRPDFAPEAAFRARRGARPDGFRRRGQAGRARFTVLRGALARLERALAQWMLTLHTEQHGYVETAVPYLVNAATMYGTGQLPKFEEDLFKTTDGRYLIPTAEVPLTNLVRDDIIAEAALPLRFTALSPCFRSEAGSAGRDTRGILRQHQFQKVEMVSVCRPRTARRSMSG